MGGYGRAWKNAIAFVALLSGPALGDPIGGEHPAPGEILLDYFSPRLIGAEQNRLDEEDFAIQLDAARRSFSLGHYASAAAELRGAILVLDQIERRR